MENLFQSLFYPLQTKFLDTVNTLCGRVPQVFLKQIEKTLKAVFEQKVVRHVRPLHRQHRWIATDMVSKWPRRTDSPKPALLFCLFVFFVLNGTCAIPRTQCGFLTSVLCLERMRQSFLDRQAFKQWLLWSQWQLDEGVALQRTKPLE